MAFSVPSLLVALAIIVVGLLLIRFVFKAAFGLLKLAILVGIAVAAYFGFKALFG